MFCVSYITYATILKNNCHVKDWITAQMLYRVLMISIGRNWLGEVLWVTSEMGKIYFHITMLKQRPKFSNSLKTCFFHMGIP